MSDPNPLAALSPPHWVITDDDHGPYVIIATWTMMCFMVMTVTARLARKISIRAWGLDDYLISAAAVSYLNFEPRARTEADIHQDIRTRTMRDSSQSCRPWPRTATGKCQRSK